MSFTEWSNAKKKKKEEESSRSFGATKTPSASGTSGSGDSKGSFAEWSDAKRQKRANDSAQGWAKSADSLLKEVQDYYSNWRNDEKQYTSYQNRISDLLAQADGWRKQYAGDKDAISSIDSVVSSLDKAKDYAYNYRKYYSQWDTEKDYSSYLAQQKDYEEKRKFDIKSGQKEIDLLENELSNLKKGKAQPGSYRPVDNSYLGSPYAAAQQREPASYQAVNTAVNGRPYAAGLQAQQAQREVDPTDLRIRELEKQISQKKQYLNQAKHIQEGITLAGVAQNADFKQHNGYVSTKEDGAWDKLTSQYGMGYEDLTYEYINNQNGIRDEIKQKHKISSGSGGESIYEKNGYDYLSENEIAVYNYYYVKDGKDAAEKYLNSIQETLNHRKATAVYGKMEGNTAQELVFGIAAGFDQFASGFKNLFNAENDYIAETAYQMASGMVREDLADDGFKLPEWLGGASIGQVGYDAITTTANMAPSMLTSIAANMIAPGSGAIIGNAMMFASSAGNAYQEALNLGYDKSQARAYSTLVGASEAGLQYLLGGISSMGGKVSGKAVSKMLDGIDNAFARTALKVGGNMLSEGFEEGLQEVLTPLFKNWTLMTDEDINWSEVAYSGLLGALTAGFMEGPTTIGGEVKTYSAGKQLQASGISAERLSEIGKTFAADTVAYQLAGKVDENTGAYTMGRLFNEIGATLTEQNVNDITNALVAKGMDEVTARKNADAMAIVVEGGNLTDLQAAVIEANETLAEAVRTTIIDSNATWFQRAKGYNEVLMQLAEETARAQAAESTSRTGMALPERKNAADERNLTGSVNMPSENHHADSEGSGTILQRTGEGITAEQETDMPAEGKTIRLDTGSAIEISGVAEAGGGKMVLALADGGTADVDNVSFATQEESAVYAAVSAVAADATHANDLITGYKNSGLSADVFSKGIQRAYNYGRNNIPESEMEDSRSIAALPTDIQRIAYQAGQAAINTEVQNASALLRSEQGTDKKHVGTVSFTDGSEIRSYLQKSGRMLEPVQETAVATMEKLSAALGVGFVVYESYENSAGNRVYQDEQGREIDAPNGYYQDGKVYIDLNAGLGGKGTMLFTVSHELTHFTKEWSPEKFKKLADFLVGQYAEKNVSISELVDRQIEKAKRGGRELSFDDAFEEVVADSMETMLTDGNVVQMMADLKQQDKTLWQKICDWFKNLANDLRAVVDAHKGHKPDSAEGRMVAEMEDMLVVFEGIYAEALADASDNHQKAEKNTAPEGGVKYSLRKFEDGTRFVDVQTDQGLFEGLSVPEMNNLAKQTIKQRFVGKVIGIDNRVFVNGASAHEYVFPSKAITPEIRAAKLRAAPELDNLLDAGRNFRNRPDGADGHIHPNAIGGFDYFDVIFKVGNEYYSGVVNIEVIKRGKLLKDVTKIKNITEDIISSYGQNPKSDFLRDASMDSIRNDGEKVNRKFSARDPAMEHANKVLQRENERLKEDVKSLKELLKLQRTVTGGTVFKKSSVEDMAKFLMKQNNAKGDPKELAGMLNSLYEYIARNEEITWDGVKETALPAVEWLQKNTVTQRDSYAEDILQHLRGSSIYLDENQKKEAAYQYGNFGNYRKLAFGTVNFSDKGSVSLDSQWHELSALYPHIFDPDITSTDMPAAFMDALDRLKNMKDMGYGFDQEMLAQDLLNQVYDSYWRVSTLRTVADVKQKQINELKSKHYQQMDKLRTFHREKTTELQQKHREELQRVRRELRADSQKKQAEITAKYQESRKKAVSKLRETAEKRDARTKLQKLVLDTAKWISYPTKTDVKCPDILKQPYVDFLNSIDMSSERLAKGGDPTKNDLRLANAMGSLATALERITTSQDPNQETTAVLDAGYLDLPTNFVQKLRDMTEDVKAMMVEGDYVVNNMSAEEVRKLSQMIRTLNHAIKEMSTLYANLRFANVEALGDNSMTAMDDLGEIQKTGGMKDFVQWENALPYYAFKRFGEGGQSIFEGLMDAQDKLAFLAKNIFDFQEKTWKGNEAKKWSEDTHTIAMSSGTNLTLTTADAMSVYCLSRRHQGIQHLLGGGVRVMGIRKGPQKAKDSRSVLTIKDVDAIISSLTDRQKRVAEAIQEFMSTTCSDWGNEISMKRFMTKEFNEKVYFPIESNDENMPTRDPSAQQSDLFRLLNISATKPIDPRANNEVIIRNIFDVFTGHASDMARLNAFGMPLLDYMKWLNYREKTINDQGQIKVRGVRKSMENAFGSAAKSYVLNLIKDVNGRPSDTGDPTILMKWMRSAKTASVGSSLRVATLQITSYPRAALVLSPKSLALGLTKLPQIEKAKKYSGIALWKSFGFYDTNISRSIEDQMKGVKDVKQKLIELSLKGAEIGDAITWGALWNACEYEVASTKKYKAGSEEFYQAVGKKLREVVYRTQVVDSTLTRSQMMRSKRGMAQEAAAFMSEPTLSANILMDAGMEFSMEKRRTNAKAAWKKTGKYVGGAISVYSIGQLTAALLEGLWDAWRDDEDEKFGEKYLRAFKENLITDIVPFNKIPIVSDVFEAVLAMFDVGYYSSDKMSTTWLTQAVSATDAWRDVLGGNSAVTTYNALYKTVRALSSFYGVSFSGVMREGVALWNNTAGAYDATLKVLNYDRSKAELGSLLLDAILEGNDRQAERFRGEFEDEDAYQSAIRSATKERYLSGEIDTATAQKYLVQYGGKDGNEAHWLTEEWSFENETGEEYGKYNKFYDAVQTGKNLKAVIKEYTDNGVEKATLSSQITSHFKAIYSGMTKSERANIKGYLLNAFEQCGVAREDAAKKLQYWEFLGEQPDSDLNQYQVADYYKFAKPAGISTDIYSDYCARVKGIDGEGKKERRMAIIDSLPISSKQKDALYFAEGWAESRLSEAPWH